MATNDQHSEKDGKPAISRRKALATVASFSAMAALPAAAAAHSGSHFDGSAPIADGVPAICSIHPRGQSRQFTTFDLKTKEKAFPIQPGEKRDLVHYKGAGVITHLWMTVSGWFWMHWEPGTYTDPTILKKLILRMYWDGNDFPSVEAPIGDFFGIGLCRYQPYLSKFLGMSSGGFYHHFPMPFEKGVRISVENLHDKVVPYVFLNANYQALDQLPEDAGRFHCLYRGGTNPGGEPLKVLETKGRGHYVGCCLSLQGKAKNYLSFLEAPEYIYIDTNQRDQPTIVGTGMEDYFNGGWYFRAGPFSGMYHGVPIKDALRSTIAMYRFHEQDAIGFERAFALSFINPRPADQLLPFKYAATAYWYQQAATRLASTLPASDQLVDWYSIPDTDHQSIP